MQIATIFLFFISTAQAGMLKSDYIKRLSHARSPNEVQQIKTQYEELQIANKACRLQIQLRQAPIACYESLQAETKQAAMRARLDNLCAEAAEKLRVARHIPPSVSIRCRRDIAAAIKILNYRESRPSWSEN